MKFDQAEYFLAHDFAPKLCKLGTCRHKDYGSRDFKLRIFEPTEYRPKAYRIGINGNCMLVIMVAHGRADCGI